MSCKVCDELKAFLLDHKNHHKELPYENNLYNDGLGDAYENSLIKHEELQRFEEDRIKTILSAIDDVMKPIPQEYCCHVYHDLERSSCYMCGYRREEIKTEPVTLKVGGVYYSLEEFKSKIVKKQGDLFFDQRGDRYTESGIHMCGNTPCTFDGHHLVKEFKHREAREGKE